MTEPEEGSTTSTGFDVDFPHALLPHVWACTYRGRVQRGQPEESLSGGDPSRKMLVSGLHYLQESHRGRVSES